ncbi:GNAT family N-acetyltransferase [Halomicrobium katesii]|uniref:GNAT family N-acetyltransferase n=1 Tax=Halomicrobium katesii TaxID=437163 RepID=UPI00037B8C47|nr:GNAT family N-acetyltransferase [Halomicrobium katesii]
MSHLEQRPSSYEYRAVESTDVQGFLDLHETVWGHERRAAWFRWRFGENPYVDEIPMVVAECDGKVVGAEPCLAFRVRLGKETVLAFQPADWVVHPDHRERGVFTGMTERLLEQYSDGPAKLYFNFPTAALVPGLESFDWTLRDGPRTHYRVQNPQRLVRHGSSSKREFRSIASRHLGRLATPLARGYLSVRDRLRRDGAAIAVERHHGVPADLLAGLSDGEGRDAVHVVRDADYYRWRFANPRWETTTYVARRDERAVAACVICREQRGDIRTTAVLDTVPRGDGVAPAAFEALLTPIVADAADSDVVKVGEGPIPPSVLDAFGFRASDAFPLSMLSDRSVLAVRPAHRSEDGTVDVAGVDPTEREWELALADRDVA